MPRNVKIFFGLCVALVAYWAYLNFMFVMFPSDHYLAVLEKLPPHVGEMARHVDLRNYTVSNSLWCAVILSLAWMAAFHRQNWARWMLVCIFALAVLVAGGLDAYVAVRHGAPISTIFHWSKPSVYIALGFKLAAIIFVFTGNARPWFNNKATL